MLVEDSEVTLEDEDWAEPAPARIDWRVCNEARRRELADKLALSLVERIEPSVTLEVGTVATAMAEITERIPVPERTVLLEPAVAAALARDGLAPEAPNEEDEAALARVMSCEQLHVIVQSEAPAHYTYLRVTKRGKIIENVVFKDSLRDPPATAARQVEKLMKSLGFVDASWQCPARSNTSYQADMWECGLWATRWLEQALRAEHFEGRIPPLTIPEAVTRANQFIEKLTEARKEKGENEARAEAKAKAKAARKARGKASAARAAKECPEPEFATLEEALEAGQKCTKCLPTRKGTKGCRGCMGKWFEEIRLRPSTHPPRPPESPEIEDFDEGIFED